MKVRGFATAATLLVLVLILFVAARLVGGQRAGEVSRRQRRKLAARSTRDLPRIHANHEAVAVTLLVLRDDDARTRSGDPR